MNKKILAAFMFVLITMLSSITVFAAGTQVSSGAIPSYIQSNGGDVSSLDGVSTTIIDPAAMPDGYNYYIYNGKVYQWKASDEQKISSGIKKTESAGTTNDVSLKMDEAITDLGVEADTATATTLLSGFSKIISTAIGILAILITLGMTLFSACDICYIAFPAIRNFCGNQLEMGQSNATVKKSEDGSVSLRWITDDAVAAVKSATVESGRNPFALYFKKRLVSYIVLVILLFILLTGNITLITDLALKIVKGILEVVGAL